MPKRRIEVFVVEDDDAVRDSLCWLAESAEHPAVGYDCAESFLAAFDATDPGCIVSDVRMPGISGIALITEITRRSRLLPVIVITAHGDIQMAVEAMKEGAFDFVEKPFEDKALLHVIGQAVDESRRRFAIRARDSELWSRLERLTPREHEVLEQLIDGRSNRLVAESLAISEKTVEAHRAHIMEKMNAASFADLVTQVVKAHLSHPGDNNGDGDGPVRT